MDVEIVQKDEENVLNVLEKDDGVEVMNPAILANLDRQAQQEVAEFQHSSWDPSGNCCPVIRLEPPLVIDNAAGQAWAVGNLVGNGFQECKDCVESAVQRNSLA